MDQFENNLRNIDQDIIGTSPAIQEVKNQIFKIVNKNTPLVLTGETGVGKTYIAELIHKYSDRKDHPFVSVNLSVLHKGLAASELFGHVKGAFTGANSSKKGLFEIANKGTVYVDELDNVDLELQAMLLHVFDYSSIRRVGSTEEIAVDVKFIASVSSNYQEKLRDGKIRQDLFDRIAVTIINIPPLRERVEDIPQLTEYFLDKFSNEYNREYEISAEAIKVLSEYYYRGNIRELITIINRAAISCSNNIITSDDLGISLFEKKEQVNIISLKSKLEQSRKIVEELRKNSIVAEPIWEGRYFPVEDNYCFVLMPFSDHSDVQKVYKNHVKPIIEKKCHLRCERADDIYDISGVMQSVWEGINRSRLIVADLTERNPNVFYELGIAHTLGKPVVMLTQSMDYVPFDLRHLRCIVYDYKPDKISELENALERTINRILSSTTYTGMLNLSQD